MYFLGKTRINTKIFMNCNNQNRQSWQSMYNCIIGELNQEIELGDKEQPE